MKNIKKKDREAFYKFVSDTLSKYVEPIVDNITFYTFWNVPTVTGNTLVITFADDDTQKSPVLSVFGRYESDVVGAANNKYNFHSFFDGSERDNFLVYLDAGINKYEDSFTISLLPRRD
jgi:hypothetical protein